MQTTPTIAPAAGPVLEPDVAPRTAARIAGLAYAAMFVLAVLANFVVIEGLVIADDPAATTTAIAADRGLFRLGIVGFLLIAVLDVVVAWALHVLLRDRGRDRSLLAAWLRVAYGVLLGVAVASLVHADALVARVGTFELVPAQVAAALDTFDLVWQLGLFVFGLHLVVVASLLVRGATPRGLGPLVAVTGAVYTVDALLQLGMPGYEAIAGVMLPLVAVPSVLAEGWLTGWLLLRAGRDGQPRRSAMNR